MRRLLPASLLFLALIAGCGDDETSGSGAASTTASSSSAGATTGDSAPGGTDAISAVDVPTIPADCPEVTTTTAAEATFPPGKPEVDTPAELPTELVITDLIDGSGAAAKAGDVVTVNYVGVRSEDGTEFDNSYDRGETFPVTLGEGGVIAGWDQGLLGIKAGGRRQLDIPADLAYGDSPQGDIIKAGDSLTFVIDAISVVAAPPAADPADAPVVEIPKSVGATEAKVTSLVEGDRCLIALPGQTARLQIILYRGDTGEEVQSTWTTGEPVDLTLAEGTIPGLVDGIVGMGVGGRRLIVLPPELGFGADRNVQMGLAAETDIVIVVDLVGLV